MSASTGASVLDRILAETRAEITRRKQDVPLAALEASAAPSAPRGFREALRRRAGTPGAVVGAAGIAVIAEFKRRSPSAGPLHESPDLLDIVAAYERGGASALSVLTEGPNFAGSLDDLRAARSACGLPVLRKDFVVDPYQLHEARVAGADAVLLIAAALGQDDLVALHELARELGLDVLVEVHHAEELRRAVDAGAELIGVNNRDLRDFSVDVERTFGLLDAMPAGATVVSESGISTAEQLRRLSQAGVHAVLVGEALMRATVPEQALARLLGIF